MIVHYASIFKNYIKPLRENIPLFIACVTESKACSNAEQVSFI